MKFLLSIIIGLFIAVPYFAQNVSLTGTVFDSSGFLVPSCQIKATDEKGGDLIGTSDIEGRFEVKLFPGIYSLEISHPGFLTIKHTEFLVINSTTGRMTTDFVLFGGKFHEPCGYSGADCLPAKSLIRSYEVRYSPKLKIIRDEFAPVPKSPKKKVPVTDKSE